MDPDDPNNGNPSLPPPAAPAPQPAANGAPAITPEIQALIDQARQDAATKAHNAAWKQARETFAKQKPSAQQPARTEDPPAPAPTDALAIIKLRDDFDDAIGDLTLTGSQKKLLRETVMEKRPGDVAGYVRTFAEMAGWVKQPQPVNPTAAQPAQPSQPANPSAPPVTGNGAPSNPTRVTDDTPILRMSTADQIALRKQIGDRAFSERMMKEFREHGTRVRLR